jgi:hypothetical protein
MCLAMNPDQLKPGQRCASTSNRNFEGRQGYKGRTQVSDWLADGSTGKRKRLTGLCALLGLDQTSVMNLRYQLLHRTAAVLLEAKRYRTRKAALVIQSFCPNATGLEDARPSLRRWDSMSWRVASWLAGGDSGYGVLGGLGSGYAIAGMTSISH